MVLTSWPCYFQAHPWFKGIEWDKLYQIKAAFIPEVNDELDTQNFEKFEEVISSFIYAHDRQNRPYSSFANPFYLFCDLLVAD